MKARSLYEFMTVAGGRLDGIVVRVVEKGGKMKLIGNAGCKAQRSRELLLLQTGVTLFTIPHNLGSARSHSTHPAN